MTPKAYLVVESEVRDSSALALYAARAQTAIAAAGGRMIAPMGAKTMTFVGETPRRIGITEWDSVEQAQGWRNSDTFKALAPLRDKAIRTIRAYVIEGL